MKFVYLIEKRPDLSDEEFVQHWTTTHADLAVQIPGLRAFEINYPSVSHPGPRPVDGYAMLRFDSYDEAQRAWATPEGKATAADGKLFVARARPLIVEEFPVLHEGKAE